MISSTLKIYLSTVLATLLFIAPNLSWATFGMIKDAQDPGYKTGLQSFKNKNYASAYQIWYPLARKGNSKAQYYIGYMYLNGIYVTKDEVEARKWFENAANQGDANAQNDLGTLYLNGQGIRKNLDIALDWFERSANQGNAQAQYNMGTIYVLRKRFTEARIWFEASAMQGYAKANYRLKELFNLRPQLFDLSAKNLVCSNNRNVRSLLPPPLCR